MIYVQGSIDRNPSLDPLPFFKRSFITPAERKSIKYGNRTNIQDIVLRPIEQSQFKIIVHNTTKIKFVPKVIILNC